MAGEETTNQGNIKPEYNVARSGLNLDQSVNQVPKGSLTYALNAAVENFDSNSVNYQNEPGNELCFDFPSGYQLIGEHFIQEKNKHIFFLANPETGGSEIGYMDNNDCIYHTLVNAPCLNFSVKHPIPKTVHKITNCTVEIYWTDGVNPRRYLDINNIPYIVNNRNNNLCDVTYTDELDCNQLKMQPIFTIPQLDVVDIVTGGDLKAGAYQFAIQYSDAGGNPYTSYYSVTNPTPIANIQLTTANFDYAVGKSIVVNVSNLDVTGQFQYFNLAVIKTINAITSVELIGTYFITTAQRKITYTGQIVTNIRLTTSDIFEKYPYYEIAQDLTAVQDILVWDNLTSIDRINYQQIANNITLQWQTYRLPANENYADELNATNLRGYMRDEVYAFEIVFLLKNGKQTDGFHIPGRRSVLNDISPYILTSNPDFIGEPTTIDPVTGLAASPYWKIYNTASVTGGATGNNIGNATPYEYGEFAYWESEERYPCNIDLWGDLADQPIRHHKFPDVLVSPHFESALFSGPSSMVIQNDAVFPIGVKIDVSQVNLLIFSSSLTDEQKADIAGFKIVRGDRSTNSSIVAKGILRNVGKYKREETEYYFPNYPYNDLREDPFLLTSSNAYTANAAIANNASAAGCRSFNFYAYQDDTEVEYVDCVSGLFTTAFLKKGDSVTVCALGLPVTRKGVACLTCNTYKRWKITLTTYNVYILQFTMLAPDGSGRVSNTPPPPYITNQGYASWCDYCAANPTTWECVAGAPNFWGFTTVIAGQFLPFQFGWGVNISGQTHSQGSYIYVNSITKPEFVSCNVSSGSCQSNYKIEEIASYGEEVCVPKPLKAYDYNDVGYRLVFNSPETSFGQPFLGDVLKLENVMFGAGRAHFVKVRDHAKYKLLTVEAQQDALASSAAIANNNATSLFAAYQAYLTIYINGITRKNYTYSFNSIASYDYSDIIDNNLGIKQRELDIAQYIIPAVLSVGDKDGININNYQRESSVYLKTAESRFGNTVTPLPFPDKTPSVAPGGVSKVIDNSRFIPSSITDGCNNPTNEIPINVISYYASIKNISISQWGQIYSYQTVDTGFQRDITPLTSPLEATIFGGDTFISRFAFKTKLPFFIDNRVGAPDDSDIFYDEIGNVAYPIYWYSARSVLINANALNQTLTNFISFKAHNLDCPNNQDATRSGIPNPGRTFYDGKMYLFAYGVPNFYCETAVNVNLRQAFNNREGDFWPHVSTGIPDDWVQEKFVTIAQDNTYFYNASYSKQNKENFFTHLPPDWKEQLCYTNYPFRAIYSDTANDNPDIRVNNWLSYSATALFDFPQNYGDLVSLDGIQNKAVLARFENKSLLYNTLLTVATSNPQAAYLGNDTLFKSSPPIDFAETDLGYVGSQNKFLLKIPQGQITVDAKRGQVFLISGNQAADLSAFGSGLNRFFTDHLAFEILRYFPDAYTDNHFNGLGLHGVYDSKYDRVIITKLDYIPINKNVKYDADTREFYLETTLNNSVIKTLVYLTDREYFCNKSWTLSYNINTQSWISFHSYIPNWYIAENNFFYSGLNDCCSEIEAIVAEIVGTTTSTTTVPVTTTTTTLYPCVCYTVSNNNGPSTPARMYTYTNCIGQTGIPGYVAPGNFVTLCALQGTIEGVGITITSGGPCTPDCTTTTTTSQTPLNCTLEGEAIGTYCELEGVAEELYLPPCSLYEILDDSMSFGFTVEYVPCGSTQYVEVTVTEGGGEVVCVNNNYPIVTISGSGTITSTGTSCLPCYCYIVTPTGSVGEAGKSVDVSYLLCDGTPTVTNISSLPDEPLHPPVFICAQEGTILITPVISGSTATVEGGTELCIQGTSCCYCYLLDSPGGKGWTDTTYRDCAGVTHGVGVNNAVVACVSEIMVLGSGTATLLGKNCSVDGDCSDYFISSWFTENPNETIYLPIYNGGTYNFTVNWGDGSPIQTITSYTTNSHTYATPEVYIITISGQIEGWSFDYVGGTSANNIIRIYQWGSLVFAPSYSPLGYNFFQCTNLLLERVVDTPSVLNVSFNGLFAGCTSLSFIKNVNLWDVSNVTDMYQMFEDTPFDSDISAWDVSSVTNMSNMFFNAGFFNQNIGNWNVGNVSNMDGMFYNASSFDQDLSHWCVTSIPSLPSAFYTGAVSWTGLPATAPQWGTCPP
jgi:hypothetical protein